MSRARSSSAEVDVEVSEDGGLLVSIDSPSTSLLLSIEPDPRPDDVEGVIREAYQEARHSTALGRSDP